MSYKSRRGNELLYFDRIPTDSCKFLTAGVTGRPAPCHLPRRHGCRRTLRSKVKSCRSADWLPRVAGNCQSTSRPSKPWRRRNAAAWRLNARRDSDVRTTGTNGREPAAQPPTASSSCSSARRFFNARQRAYRPDTHAAIAYRVHVHARQNVACDKNRAGLSTLLINSCSVRSPARVCVACDVLSRMWAPS